ncbi:uncharacterized protein VTP21DRAFT_4788 [Calcarisporiella thermophila]|uniref:uncharacterized protein n=1 Tax=Calcarisporiella thermophila TaxID=911321 RepID=UPI0037447C1F
MKESESALYEYSRCRGSSSFILSEDAQSILSLYNCAYLMAVLSEILPYFSMISGLCSMKLLECSGTAYLDAAPLQLYVSSLPLRLENLIGTISSEMKPLNRAELLLYLYIIKVHSRFLKLDESLFVSIDYHSLVECITSADEIVDLVEMAIGDQNSKSFHSTMVFGLNTSACVFFIAAVLGSAEQQRSALFGLRRILEILKNPLLLYQDFDLIHGIEEVFYGEKNDNIVGYGSESFNTASVDSTTVSAVIPTVGLSSIVNVEPIDRYLHPNRIFVIVHM